MASDEETLEPDVAPVADRQLATDEVSEAQVHERLADLGYKA